MVRKCFLLGITGFALLLAQPLFAQKEGAVWHFGAHAGLDFTGYYPQPVSGGQTNSSEGVAAISDKNGNLLFYTDGQTVWRADHTIMTNGAGLKGDTTATQSSLIVPWPNHPNQFYLFTIGPVGSGSGSGKGLYYSIVNLSVPQVDPSNLNVSLLENCTEKITAIRHSNGVDWWILAHQLNTFEFNIYLLSNDLRKLGDQIIGSEHKGATGYMKASPKGDLVAIATEGIQNTHLEIFKFNNETGQLLQDPQAIKLQPESMYGVEFSPNGKYIYATNRQKGTLYRWNLENFTQVAVQASQETLFSEPGLGCGALQLALNGKIYLAYNEKTYLGVINSPDFEACNFVKKGASLYDYTSGFKGISGFGLPNFVASDFNYDFYYTNACVGDSTLIYMASNAILDVVRTWEINGEVIGGIDNSLQIKYLFTAPGTYPITVNGLKNGVEFPFRDTVRIHPKPTFAIGDTTYICGDQTVELHDGHYAFYGITNQSDIYSDSVRSINQPGLYRVTATNYQGCTAEKTTRAIRIEKPEIDSIAVIPAGCNGTDNGSIRIIMKGNPADYSFSWSGNPGSAFIENLGPGSYTAHITMENGCSVDTTITVGTAQLPVKITRFPDNPAAVCPGTLISLTASGADSYVWEHDPTLTGNSIDAYPDTTTIFKVTGSNAEGTCFGSDSILVEVFPNNKLDLGPDLFLCGGSRIVLRGSDYDPDSQYREWSWSTGFTTDSLVVTNTILGLYLRVKDVNGCYYDDYIDITFNPKVKVKIVPSIPVDSPVCYGVPITLTATGADSYIWENPSGILQDTVTIYPVSDAVYIVTGMMGDSCFGSDTLSIKVYDNHPFSLGEDRTACIGDTIIIHARDYDPDAIYSDWHWSTNALTDSLVALHSINKLTLSVKDQNGCPYTDTINIDFSSPPVISYTKNDISCFGNQNGSINIIAESGSASDLYSIDEEESWSGQLNYTNLPAGNYLIKARTDAGCTTAGIETSISEPDSLEHQINPIAPSCPECTDGEIRVSVSGGTEPYSYSWNGYNNHDSLISGIGEGNYSLTITDGNGCQKSITYHLLALKMFIPNAFSPNGGTRNEKWVLKILDNRPDCLVQVYDRSGKLVFSDDGYYDPWDGTYLNQGKKLPASTYFYLIRIDRNDDSNPPQKGTVTILR